MERSALMRSEQLSQLRLSLSSVSASKSWSRLPSLKPCYKSSARIGQICRSRFAKMKRSVTTLYTSWTKRCESSLIKARIKSNSKRMSLTMFEPRSTSASTSKMRPSERPKISKRSWLQSGTSTGE